MTKLLTNLTVLSFFGNLHHSFEWPVEKHYSYKHCKTQLSSNSNRAKLASLLGIEVNQLQYEIDRRGIFQTTLWGYSNCVFGEYWQVWSLEINWSSLEWQKLLKAVKICQIFQQHFGEGCHFSSQHQGSVIILIRILEWRPILPNSKS